MGAWENKAPRSLRFPPETLESAPLPCERDWRSEHRSAGERRRWERYDPENDIAADIRDASGVETHGGSDFYPTHCFVQKILGKEDGKWCIDVYQAVDMSLCGLFAFRSILAGNTSMEIPNLRNKEERDLWRNDHACTNPDIAGDQLLPTSSYPALAQGLSDEEYAAIKRVWREKHKHDGESE